MPFKKILVPVTGASSDKRALATAFAAAAPFAGHVEALFVYPDPQAFVPFVGMPVSPEVVQEIIDSADKIAREARAKARANTEAAAKDAGAEFLERPAAKKDITCSFREVQGGFISRLREAAKLCDLVVFGAPTAEGGPDITAAFIEILTESNRPVLLAPSGAVAPLTPKIAVGWDGSAAAAHALSAALPFLAAADAVELLTIKTDGATKAGDALEYLSLHGIKATARVFDPKGAAPGEVLLREAEADGATLIVLGGYGHSRLFETLFGGTTVHMAAHSTLPLFMVH